MMKPVVIAMAIASCFGLKHDLNTEFASVMTLLSKLNSKTEGIRAAAYNMKDVNERSMAKLHAIEAQEARAYQEQMEREDSEFDKLKASLDQEASRHFSQ